MTSTTTAGDTALGTIGQIAITVADVDRAVAFYRDALRLRFLFAAGPRLAFLDAGGVRVMLSAPEAGFTPGADSMVLYFTVPDIARAHADLAARGVPFVDAPHLIARMPDHDLWMCFLRDPDGHTIGLMSEVRPPAPR